MWGSKIRIYDVGSTGPAVEYTLESPPSIAVSPDGKHFAAFMGVFPQVGYVATGETRGVLQRPKDNEDKGLFLVDEFVFSPRNDELAAIVEAGSVDQVVCWDVAGNVTFSHKIPKPEPGKINRLTWVPDGRGLLVRNEILLLREPKVVVWRLAGCGGTRFLDNDELLVGPDEWTDAWRESCTMHAVPVPWETINKAAAALKAGAPAALTPGEEITVEVNVTEVQQWASADVVEPQITKLFERLCTSSGLVVAPEAELVLEVEYSERDGPVRKVTPLPPDAMQLGPLVPGDQSPTMIDTVCVLHAELLREGQNDPLWECDYESPPSGLIKGSNQIAIRKAAFEAVRDALRANGLPSFIAKDPDIPMLPVLSRIGE